MIRFVSQEEKVKAVDKGENGRNGRGKDWEVIRISQVN